MLCCWASILCVAIPGTDQRVHRSTESSIAAVVVAVGERAACGEVGEWAFVGWGVEAGQVVEPGPGQGAGEEAAKPGRIAGPGRSANALSEAAGSAPAATAAVGAGEAAETAADITVQGSKRQSLALHRLLAASVEAEMRACPVG